MEIIELVSQLGTIMDDAPEATAKPFIFSKSLQPAASNLRMIMPASFVSMGYEGF
jgi:hypothetical protein